LFKDVDRKISRRGATEKDRKISKNTKIVLLSLFQEGGEATKKKHRKKQKKTHQK